MKAFLEKLYNYEITSDTDKYGALMTMARKRLTIRIAVFNLQNATDRYYTKDEALNYTTKISCLRKTLNM